MNTLDPSFWRQRIQDAETAGATDPLRRALGSYDANQQSLGQFRTIIKKYIPENSSVLEIGCGCGDLAPLMPKGVKYLGTDMMAEFIWEARRTYPEHQFEIADATDVNFWRGLTAHYDIVFGTSVLGTVMGALSDETRSVLFRTIFDKADALVFWSPQHKSPDVWRLVDGEVTHTETAS